MPLCTILTKCPAPPGPTQSQHGVPSGVRAAIACRMGRSSGQAAAEPPGMIEGPCRAPSAPPETPAPTYSRPCASTSPTRRAVSAKWELPPSTMTSPGSSTASSPAMMSSTGWPARTMSSSRRGRASRPASSANDQAGRMPVPAPGPARNSPMRAGVWLWTATPNPWSRRLSARFWPITPRPIRPMSAASVTILPFRRKAGYPRRRVITRAAPASSGRTARPGRERRGRGRSVPLPGR